MGLNLEQKQTVVAEVAKEVAGAQVGVLPDGDLSGFEELGNAPAFARAGAQDVRSRAGEVPGRSVGLDVFEVDPQIHVRGVRRKKDFRLDRSDHPQVPGQQV